MGGGGTPIPFLGSVPAPRAIAVPDADGAGVAFLVGVRLCPVVMSTASATPSSASAISTSRAHLSPPPSALAHRRCAVWYAPEIGPIVFVVHPAGVLLLLSRGSLVPSSFFAHLLLNAMLFQLQLEHFSCVWLHREPCCVLHPTTLNLWVLVRSSPEQ